MLNELFKCYVWMLLITCIVILACMIQCKRQWSNLSQGARVSSIFFNHTFFRSFENCFLKPGVESRWVESKGEESHVNLNICHPDQMLSLPIYLLCSLILFTVVFVLLGSFSTVCWCDWQGENHSSLLISQVLLGKRAPQICSFKTN